MAPPVQTQRLFVAIDPPPDAVADLTEAMRTLAVVRLNAPGASTRVVPPERWHITLAFLGDVRLSRVEAAATCLDRAGADPEVVKALPMRLRLAGGGRFGRGGATTLWAGLEGDVTGLRTLGAQVRRQLRRGRIHFDGKPLRPHLTLARPGVRVPPESIVDDVALLRAYAGPLWPLDAVHLYRSEFLTRPDGVVPSYTRLHTTLMP